MTMDRAGAMTKARTRGRGRFPVPVVREDPERWEALAEEIRETRYSPGKRPYLRYLAGERLTIGEAVRAMCHTCHGREFGNTDCHCPTCPLYPWHASREA